MKKEIIFDSSSLILLAKIGLLDKIAHYLQKIAITEQIYNECVMPKDSFDAKIIKKRVEEKLIGTRTVKDQHLCQKIKDDFNLGKGEAEGIAFCMENKIGFVTDDKKAMSACRILNIEFTTALNLIIISHNRSVINKKEAEAYIGKLENFGRYSKELLQKCKEELKNDKDE